MVDHFARRTYRVNQEFRNFEGIWLHRKSRQIRICFGKRPILLHTCATGSELPSYISTMYPSEITGNDFSSLHLFNTRKDKIKRQNCGHMAFLIDG